MTPKTSYSVLAFLFILASLALGQSTSGRGEMPPGTIDGSVHPELVPDEIAYRLFFLAVSESKSPTADRARRQQAKLSPLLFDEDDGKKLIAILADFRTSYYALPELQQPSTADSQAWNVRRDAVLNDALTAMRAQLTPSAMTRLDAYVKSRKSHMYLAPNPSM